MLFESDEHETYPGRKFVQGAQVILVIAIVAFGIMALTPSDDTPTPLPDPVAIPTSTPIPGNTAESIYDQALAIHDEGYPKEAIGLYTQALELDPTIANAWLGRAVAYEQTGDTDSSRNDFRRYVQHMQTERIERDITVGKTLGLDMVEGRVFALSFEAHSGDVLDITADSLEQEDEDEVVDPLILLVLDDVVLQSDDDTLKSDGTLINMNSHIDDYKITRDGTYTLLVSHAGGGSYGMVEVKTSLR